MTFCTPENGCTQRQDTPIKQPKLKSKYQYPPPLHISICRSPAVHYIYISAIYCCTVSGHPTIYIPLSRPNTSMYRQTVGAFFLLFFLVVLGWIGTTAEVFCFGSRVLLYVTHSSLLSRIRRNPLYFVLKNLGSGRHTMENTNQPGCDHSERPRPFAAKAGVRAGGAEPAAGFPGG